MPKLPAIEISSKPSTKEPVIFLHGFGGFGLVWRPLQKRISHLAPTLAFDLPGHGDALNYPGFGPPVVGARAVIEDLDRRGITQAHLVGHSMGGAVASLIGLLAPKLVASLTLLAPGGYGTEFNHSLLMRWAQASTASEISSALSAFFGDGFELPSKAIEIQQAVRSKPGATDALVKIAAAMSRDGKQGMLPIDDVLAGKYPVSVIWGTEDRVLPVTQGRALEGKVDLHIVEGMGHSPAEEAPDLVQSVIEKQLS